MFMQTANTLPRNNESSREAGTDLHLAKPITPAALSNAIEQIDQAHEPTQPVSMASG
jgi:CheY-like chemotaxis protein